MTLTLEDKKKDIMNFWIMEAFVNTDKELEKAQKQLASWNENQIDDYLIYIEYYCLD